MKLTNPILILSKDKTNWDFPSENTTVIEATCDVKDKLLDGNWSLFIMDARWNSQDSINNLITWIYSHDISCPVVIMAPDGANRNTTYTEGGFVATSPGDLRVKAARISSLEDLTRLLILNQEIVRV
jgi:hypothetical protein